MKIRVKPLKDYVLFLLIFSLMTLNYKPQYIWSINLFLVVIGLIGIYVFFNILYKRKLYLDFFFINFVLFIVWSGLTKIWAISDEYYKAGINSMFLTLFILFLLTNLIQTKSDIYVALKSIAWSGFFMFLYFSAIYGLQTVIFIRASLKNPVLNANIYGLCLVFSSIIFYYLSVDKRKYGTKKNIYIILSFVLLILSLLSGSRKVMLIFLIVVLGTYILNNMKLSWIKLIIGFMLILLLYYLVKQNQLLYYLIGSRIDETLNFFSNEGVSNNSSTGIRNNMINLGITLFKERPFFGYGVYGSNFFNNGVYLHNNYVELLVNTGVIGTIIYYNSILKLLIKGLIRYIRTLSFSTLFFFLLVLSLVIMDYTIVSYNDRVILTVWIIISKISKFSDFERSTLSNE